MDSAATSEPRERSAPATPFAPRVSVVIPAYQAATFIVETLESVLRQTMPDFEIVVINDGSPDTPEFERALEPYRGRIVYIHKSNGGPGDARNAGILRSRAPLVAFLDADDLWTPDFLAEQVGYLDEHPQVDLVYADGVDFGAAWDTRPFMTKVDQNGETTTERLLGPEYCIATSTVVVRRHRLLDVGLFDPDRDISEDFDLWLRLAKHGCRIGYQRKMVLYHRRHDASYSAVALDSVARSARVLNAFAKRPDVTPAERAVLERTLGRIRAFTALEQGKLALDAGRGREAEERFRVASSHFNSWKLRATRLGLRVLPGLVSWGHRLRTARRISPLE